MFAYLIRLTINLDCIELKYQSISFKQIVYYVLLVVIVSQPCIQKILFNFAIELYPIECDELF